MGLAVKTEYTCLSLWPPCRPLLFRKAQLKQVTAPPHGGLPALPSMGGKLGFTDHGLLRWGCFLTASTDRSTLQMWWVQNAFFRLAHNASLLSF